MVGEFYVNQNKATQLWINCVKKFDFNACDNGDLVYEETLELWLPKYDDSFSLAEFIENNNPKHYRKIIVHNEFDQPTMDSGNLFAFDVQLIVEPEASFIATDSNQNGINVCSEFTLLNHGIISGYSSANSHPITGKNLLHQNSILGFIENGTAQDNVDITACNKYRTLELHLPPVKSITILADFIDDHQPTADKFKNVKILNTLTYPTIQTGDLSGLNVTLFNNGDILGRESSDDALEITSTLKLVNWKTIKGAGGDGVPGDKGKDSGAGGAYIPSGIMKSYKAGDRIKGNGVTTGIQMRLDYKAGRKLYQSAYVMLDPDDKIVPFLVPDRLCTDTHNTHSAPKTFSKGTIKIAFGIAAWNDPNSNSSVQCSPFSKAANDFSVELPKYCKTKPGKGGNGGLPGRGLSFHNRINVGGGEGSTGSADTTSCSGYPGPQGKRGGKGYNGGLWGKPGHGPFNSSEGGYSINGISHLVQGSKLGTLVGRTK